MVNLKRIVSLIYFCTAILLNAYANEYSDNLIANIQAQQGKSSDYISNMAATYASGGNSGGFTPVAEVVSGASAASANWPTAAQINDQSRITSITNCISSSETFSNGNIHIFWTNERAIPVESLNINAPGWQLHMIMSADFAGNGTTQTQDWLMHSSMVSGMGRGIDLDMPPELNGKTVTVSFYVTDAQGNPLMTKTDTETNTTSWAIGSKANNDKAYVFGSAVAGEPATAISFTVNRDPASGEQAPKVAGYNLSGNSLTINFATPLDPFTFHAAYVIVNGIYTQITDFRYMLSNGATSLTVDLNAFDINIPKGAKVEFVVKEWAHGMTLKQTVIDAED